MKIQVADAYRLKHEKMNGVQETGSEASRREGLRIENPIAVSNQPV